MKNPLVIPALAALLLITAAGLLGQSSDRSPASDPRKEVLARLAEMQRAAEALDVDKLFSFVLENGAGAVAQNGKVHLTRQDAYEATRSGLRGLQKLTYSFDQQQVTLLSTNIALVVGEGSTSAALEDGRTIDLRFAQSIVFIHTNGQWKVFHSHRSFPRSL